MSNAIDYLKVLSFDNRKWITDLKNKICLTGFYTMEDINTAVNYFLLDDQPEEINTPQITTNRTDRKKLIYKLYDNKNISGLIDNQEIEFSPFFTLIYGKNGSGKSSYYKILKNIFYEKQNLKPNIYNTSTATMSANINLISENQFKKHQRKGDNLFPHSPSTIEWNEDTLVPSKIKFCDTNILDKSLSKKETGWSVDRYKLDYYETFRRAIEEVTGKISDKTQIIQTEKNALQQTININLKSKEESSIYSKINNSQTIISELERLISIDSLSNNFDEKKELCNQKANQSVDELNDNITSLSAKIKLYDNYIQYINTKFGIYNKLNSIKETIEELQELKRKRDFSEFNGYELVFSLEHEHKDIYIELLKNIVKTAEQYEKINYPQDIDKCFYCNQDLPEDNKNLIEKIHQTIDDKIENSIQSNKTLIDNLITEINKFINLPNDIYSNITVCETSSLKTMELNEFSNILIDDTINKNLSYLQELDIENLSSLDNNINQLEEYQKLLITTKNIFDFELINLKQDFTNFEIIKNEAKKELNILLDEEYCFNNKDSLISIINKTNILLEYRTETDKISTFKRKLSRDKSRVEEELLRRNYVNKFNTNLLDFKLINRDQINRKFSISSGQTTIEGKISANDTEYKISDILSEGEAKVYSLCDWFTELEFDDINTIIFDDPITSLDQNNIKQLAKKISSLANKYQIIIFTHNMEFYKYLVDYSLGSKLIDSPKCKICEELEGQEQCQGFKNNENKTYKCGTYLKVEHFIQPGKIKKGINYNTLNYLNKLKPIKERLEGHDMTDVVVNLRGVINDFIEQYRFNNIKRDIYKGEDLIHFDIRDISEESLSNLKQFHHTLSSSSGLLHSQDDEISTELDPSDYIEMYNNIINIVNTEASQTLSKIELT